MNNLDFLRHSPDGDATITILVPGSASLVIPHLNMDIISQKAPILAASFEHSRSGPRYSFEGSSPAAVMSFLRYLYLGDYRLVHSLIDQPCSQLIHFQLYHFGDTYGIYELTSLARLHTIRETELSCSTGRAPPELAAAIRFLYEKLPKCRDLRDIIVHYCINCFCYHNLDEDFEFRRVTHDIPDFLNDLFRANHLRGFSDEGAEKLFQLPVCKPTPHPNAQLEKQALGDYIYKILGENSFEEYRKGESVGSSREPAQNSVRLPYRPQVAENSTARSQPEESSCQSPFSFSEPKYSEAEANYVSFGPALFTQPTIKCSTCSRRLERCYKPLTGNQKCAFCLSSEVIHDRSNANAQSHRLPYRPLIQSNDLADMGYVPTLWKERSAEPSTRPLQPPSSLRNQLPSTTLTALHVPETSTFIHNICSAAEQPKYSVEGSNVRANRSQHRDPTSFRFPAPVSPSSNIKRSAAEEFDEFQTRKHGRTFEYGSQRFISPNVPYVTASAAQTPTFVPTSSVGQLEPKAAEGRLTSQHSLQQDSLLQLLQSSPGGPVINAEVPSSSRDCVEDDLMIFELEPDDEDSLNLVDRAQSSNENDDDLVVIDPIHSPSDNDLAIASDSEWSIIDNVCPAIAQNDLFAVEETVEPISKATNVTKSASVSRRSTLPEPSGATTEKMSSNCSDWTLL